MSISKFNHSISVATNKLLVEILLDSFSLFLAELVEFHLICWFSDRAQAF